MEGVGLWRCREKRDEEVRGEFQGLCQPKIISCTVGLIRRSTSAERFSAESLNSYERWF